jgi:hypothetical protein
MRQLPEKSHLLNVPLEVLRDEVLRQEAEGGVTAAKAQLTCSSNSSSSISEMVIATESLRQMQQAQGGVVLQLPKRSSPAAATANEAS